MKKYFMPSIKAHVCITCSLFGDLYLYLFGQLAKLTPGEGDGETVTVNGKVVGYAISWSKVY